MRRAQPHLLVYVDGSCPNCRSAGRLLKRLDLLGTLDVRSFRHDRSFERYGLTADDVARELQVIVPAAAGYRAFGGFEAVRALLRHIPLLWPLLPAAWLMAVSGQGARAYRWLAERRTLVPDAGACGMRAASGCPAHRSQRRPTGFSPPARYLPAEPSLRRGGRGVMP